MKSPEWWELHIILGSIRLCSELYAPVSGTGAMSIAQAVTHICENFVGRQRSARGRFACADFIGGFDIISDESGNCSGTIVSESEALSYSFFRRAGADAVLKKLGSSAPSERLIRSNLSATTTINMADYCDDISKVTINDFLFTITNINAYCTSWGHPSDKGGPATSNNFQPVSGSYNAETGILTVTISVPTYSSGTYGQTGGGSCKITPRVNVYFFG